MNYVIILKKMNYNNLFSKIQLILKIKITNRLFIIKLFKIKKLVV